MEIVGYEVDEAGSPTNFSLWVVHNNDESIYKLDITTKTGMITTPNLNGVDGTYVGDQAKMKLYSFRFFNRWIKNKHYTCEYLMRRFGFEEELFIDGSYFIS